MTDKRIAVVTGANRGIGLEVCRQLAKRGVRVILTSRSESQGQAACDQLKTEGLDVRFHRLDVMAPDSIERLRQAIEHDHDRLDILVNNAGIFLDTAASEASSVLAADLTVIRQTMETNVYGPLRLCQAVAPIMARRDYGRIVNLSSGLGQLCDMTGNYPAYRLSKASLNAVTRLVAGALAQTNVLVNAVCPGWVRTAMGGSDAERSVEEGADTVVWLALLPDGGPTGGLFRDREPIPW